MESNRPDLKHTLMGLLSALHGVVEDMTGDPAALQRARNLQTICIKRLTKIIEEVGHHVASHF